MAEEPDHRHRGDGPAGGGHALSDRRLGLEDIRASVAQGVKDGIESIRTTVEVH